MTSLKLVRMNLRVILNYKKYELRTVIYTHKILIDILHFTVMNMVMNQEKIPSGILNLKGVKFMRW